MKPIKIFLAVSLFCISFQSSAGSPREMGTGIPVNFGIYSAAVGTKTAVWQIDSAAVPFPPDCGNGIILSEATMGTTSYSIAVSVLINAKKSGKTVRFFAHDTRDGGCGVDFVQLM